jgi:peptidoglycan/LPS O-acetylase OafA/YrhL
MPDSARSTHRRDIDGLRAVAVLAVVLHHVAPTVVTGGFAGVDVFFVISGYLITRIIDDAVHGERFSYIDFLWRRCRRILPPLLVVLPGTLLIGACVLTGPEFESLALHALAGTFSASNLLLWSEVGYFDTSAALKPLLHLWSLGVEEQFYLIWPVLLTALPRAHRTRWLAVAAIVMVSLLLSENLAYSDPAHGFYLLHSRAWELGAGGLIALAIPLVPSSWSDTSSIQQRFRTPASVVGGALLIAAIATLDQSSSWPGISALAPVVGTMLLIAAGPNALLNRSILSAHSMQWLGQRSYALYLWHWPLLAFLHILAPELGLSAQTQTALAVGLMLTALALAHATLVLVELPSRALARRVEARGPIVARSLLPFAAAMAVVATSAGLVVGTHGMPWRYGAAGDDAVAVLRAASPDSVTAYTRSATRCTLPDTGYATWCWRVPGDGAGIAVFGDSHAEGVFASLVASRPGVPLLLTGRKGCAPIVQHAVIDDRTGEICRRASSLAHATILRDTSLHTVLLVARGPAYLSGVGFGVDTMRRVVPVTTGDSLAMQRAYDDGLTRSITTLLAAGKRVLLVLDVPELGFMPDECVIGRPLGLRTLREPCAVPVSAVRQRNARYTQYVRALQQRIPSLEVLDAATTFCDTTLCHARRGRHLLYSDANHLTAAGGRLVFERLRPHLALTPRTMADGRATGQVLGGVR